MSNGIWVNSKGDFLQVNVTGNSPEEGATLVSVAPVNKFQKWNFDTETWDGNSQTLEEKYGNLRNSLMLDSGWQRVSHVVANNGYSEFVSQVVDATNYLDDGNTIPIKYLWNQMIAVAEGMSQAPTAQEIAAWQAISKSIGLRIADLDGDTQLSMEFDETGRFI